MEERLTGFIIWAIMGVLFIVMGIYELNSKKAKPFGFWANAETAPIEDVKGYNHALGILWCVYGILFTLIGLPLLAGENSGLIIISILGAAFISIGAMIVYVVVIEPKYPKRDKWKLKSLQGDCMRKIPVIALTFVIIFSLAGCSDKTLTYNRNLGYDLSKVDYESVAFNVYHSNTKNHTWEHLTTFSYSPKKNNFVDVRVEGAKNCITITFEENRVEKTENTESYYTEDIDTYAFTVDGFEGEMDLCQYFEVKDTDEEQFCQLYPIDNDNGGTIFPDLKIDMPYDEEEENLDNILITIEIQ